ncbi:MAG: M13 family metallopeptidase [Pirellulaceae bacterium]
MKMLKLLVVLAIAIPLSNVQAQEDKALDSTTFDTSIRPQDDLYQAVNGTWLKVTDIPSDKSNYGSFSHLQDEAERQIREIIEEAAAADHPQGSDGQKVGDFYTSFMDVDRIEERGYQPLVPEIKKIQELETHEDVIRHMGYLQKLGVSTPIGFGVTIDAKDSTRYLSVVIQSGTTLPDRDYYLKDDEKYVAVREELVKHVNRLFELAEFQDAERGNDILDLESRLAEVQWTRTQLRDANARYNLFNTMELTNLGNNINWQKFFTAADVGNISEVNVMTPSFFEGLDTIVADVPVETWKSYLLYHLMDAYATVLSQDFVDADFHMHDEVLAGIPEQKPRWKNAVASVAGGGAGDFGALGEVVGRLYVERHFPQENKEKMDRLVQNLLRAFGESIDELAWMTDATKEMAREKLGKITTKIGYPEKWRDYSGLTVVPDDLFANTQNSLQVEYNRMITKLGQPIDRTEWGMTPQTINAYYNPTMNEIVFPAAILQPPFFNVEADDAINYGGIGAVIGHEISHAFDDQGSKYDGNGNLNNWWTDDDRASFSALTKQLVDQYSEYEPMPGKKVNGELTLGENIADLSGLAIAFKAYKLSLDGSEAPEIAGWSGDQRFFLGWSQIWRRKYRDAEMVRRLLRDPHSPSWYRANGPVTNIDEFYVAFDVNPGDKLFKPTEDRIKIW